MLRFKNEKDFKRKINHKIRGSRTRNTIYQNNEFEYAYKQAVETLRYLKTIDCIMLFGSLPLEISVTIPTIARGDGSNYLKGVEDALNSIAYKDDKQIKKGSFSFD